MVFENGKNLSRRASRYIPGGCHTYAKGDNQYPADAPSMICRGKGSHVWDTDGNEFIEYGMGLRAVTLGHAFEPVVEAAYEQMKLGSNFTRPATIELEYAEALLEVLPQADMVKFAKDGSTVTTAAVKLARAVTGRSKVAYCRDHPFFSYDDWFIGTTAMNAGIPREISDLSVGFHYNDLDSLQLLFDENEGQVACVILEPEREIEPEEGFLQGVRDMCTRHGALLVFDEMITGFRWAIGGAQDIYGVVPDLSTFGKAIANGFAVSVLAGKRDVMELGGWDHDKARVFLLSTTHGAETHSLAAAKATLRVYQQEDVVGHLHRQGVRLRDGINALAESAGIGANLNVFGHPSNLIFSTKDNDGNASQEFRTLVLQELVEKGILAPSLVVSYSHSDRDVEATISAFESVIEAYKLALDNGIGGYLKGRPVEPVFLKRGRASSPSAW